MNALISLFKLKLTLIGKNIKDLVNLLQMTNSQIQAILKIINSLTPSAYLANQNLLLILISQSIRLSIKYGNASFSIYNYSVYGMICCGGLEDIKTGYQLEELSLNLLSKLQAKQQTPKVLATVNFGIKHWHDYSRQTLNSLKKAYQSGLKVGDLEFVGYIADIYGINSLHCYPNLETLERELSAFSEVLKAFKQQRNFQQVNSTRQVILNLINSVDNPYILVGEVYN